MLEKNLRQISLNQKNYGKEIEGYIEIESNIDQYKDLEYLKLRLQGLRLEKVDKELESDFINKYFKENKKEDKKEDEDKSDDISNVLKDTEEGNKEEISKKGDKIIKEMGQDYKNVHFKPEPMEGSSGFFNRDIGKFYEEKEELPPQQVEGLFEEDGEKSEDENINNISIGIIENDGSAIYIDNNGEKHIITLSLLKSKKEVYKELKIGKICREVIKDTKGKRRAGILLKKKINPEIIKILDHTGNTDLIRGYIESIYTKNELPFKLTHNLSGLNTIQKLRLRKYTKTEEISGAEIIGKLWDKNKALPKGNYEVSDSVELVDDQIKEEKEKLSKNVQEIIEPKNHITESEKEVLLQQELERRKLRRERKENASFVQKVDGKNEEIAKKYREESKKQTDELLNVLNENNGQDKFNASEFINENGIDALKQKYQEQHDDESR